jgi:hypothetical protein
MTEEKPKRKFIDWDSIEPLYRAGVLSLHGICHQYKEDHKYSQTWKKEVSHGIISRHAGVQKWTRDLSGKVKARIEEQLITKSDVEYNKEKRISDRDVIEQAATAGSGVILRHRKEIFALAVREDALLTELDGIGVEKNKIPSLKDKSLILKNIAAVRTQRITLERQAHNLNAFDKKENEDTGNIVDIFKQLSGILPE